MPLGTEGARGLEPKRAVVTVLGQDRVGIIARVAAVLAGHGCNIEDIRQTLIDDLFTMIVIVNMGTGDTDVPHLSEELAALGVELGLDIRVQSEAVFRAMHRV